MNKQVPKHFQTFNLYMIYATIQRERERERERERDKEREREGGGS